MNNLLDTNFLIFLLLLSFIGLLYLKYSRLKDSFRKIEEENSSLKRDNRKLKQLERVKSDFVNVAAHQLRTPLTKVKWALQSIKNSEALNCLSPDQRRMVDDAFSSNEAMIRLLNDLLNVGKIEGDKLGYNFKKESIIKIAEEVVQELSYLANKKNIKVRIMKPDEMPLLVMDAQKIRLVLSNLIENAINYTPENGYIGIILENFGTYVKIAVKDSGIGIPKEELGNIFSRFFRAKNAVRVRTEGTGLGLYIAKNIVEMHGGRIWVESEEGKGTTVYFTLPFTSVKKAEENIKKFIEGI